MRAPEYSLGNQLRQPAVPNPWTQPFRAGMEQCRSKKINYKYIFDVVGILRLICEQFVYLMHRNTILRIRGQLLQRHGGGSVNIWIGANHVADDRRNRSQITQLLGVGSVRSTAGNCCCQIFSQQIFCGMD